jgi:hypothetical protein
VYSLAAKRGLIAVAVGHRARPDSLGVLYGALESASKWLPADEVPKRGLAVARPATAVVAEVDVDTDPATTFAAFTDPVMYSRLARSL